MSAAENSRKIWGQRKCLCKITHITNAHACRRYRRHAHYHRHEMPTTSTVLSHSTVGYWDHGMMHWYPVQARSCDFMDMWCAGPNWWFWIYNSYMARILIRYIIISMLSHPSNKFWCIDRSFRQAVSIARTEHGWQRMYGSFEVDGEEKVRAMKVAKILIQTQSLD